MAAGPNFEFIARVARIINENRIIIDVGKDTLSIGDHVYIFEPCDELCSYSGYHLGVYEKVKAHLEVIHVAKNYSECAMFTERETYPLPIPENVFSVKKIKEEAILPVRHEDIKSLTVTGTNYIKVGDYVNKYWHNSNVLVEWRGTERSHSMWLIKAPFQKERSFYFYERIIRQAF